MFRIPSKELIEVQMKNCGDTGGLTEHGWVIGVTGFGLLPCKPRSARTPQ